MSAQFMDPRLPDRFWGRVIPDPMGGCWLFVGACVGEYGYARIPWVKSRLAHRITYETLVGPVPGGLELDHLCRVRSCCNPAHLEAVTHHVNMARGISPAAQNLRKNRCSICQSEYTPEGDWRRCRACRRRAKNAANANRAELGICRSGPSHGPATHGLRCADCAAKHRATEEIRRLKRRAT